MRERFMDDARDTRQDGDVGDDLHIHRADEWVAASEQPITREEWAAYAVASPSFDSLVPFLEVIAPDGSVLGMEGEGYAYWPGRHSSRAVFAFRGGRIVVTSPDDATVRRMYEVAAALGARVQGDEHEFY